MSLAQASIRRSTRRPVAIAPGLLLERPPAVHLFQIAYSAETRVSAEQGVVVLDNTANDRPDWYEYWPIRNFLLTHRLDDTAFYGFFSPKFTAKTGLTHADVIAFIKSQATKADVALFSPQPDMGAFFLNVFEQAELFDPGAIDAFTRVLDRIGRPTVLTDLVMDARQIVFSNYFVARPAFWREWLAVNEAMFAICEGPEDPLKALLCRPTAYPGAVERKVFLQERVASFLLATQPQWRSVAHNPFAMAWSLTHLRDHPDEAFAGDALKSAYRDRGYPQYLHAYAAMRERLRGPRPEERVAIGDTGPERVFHVCHPSWTADLVADPKSGRLRHALHGSAATYHLHGDLLVVAWDDYEPEIFVRDGEIYRPPRRGAGQEVDALQPFHAMAYGRRLPVEAVTVQLPDAQGSVIVRPGTSDVPVFDAIFTRQDYAVAQLPDRCEVVVDLGANTGLASLYFAQLYPDATIVAVEPARNNFRLLTAHALDRSNIVPVEAAIASRDGRLELQDRVSSHEAMQPWAYRTAEQGSGLGSYTVAALSLPTLMTRYGLGSIDILKIDIEGAEFDLFSQGVEAWLPSVRLIMIETHERFVPGVDDLISGVLHRDFDEWPSDGECRIFRRRA